MDAQPRAPAIILFTREYRPLQASFLIRVKHFPATVSGCYTDPRGLLASVKLLAGGG